MRFEWDENKDRINMEKHGISFSEASTVFCDENAVLFDDPDNSEREDRFLIMGFSQKARICIVSHCCRGDDDAIRIISARKATRREAEAYNTREGEWY